MKKYLFSTISILGIVTLLLSACGSQSATPVPAATSVPLSEVIAEGKIRPALASNLSFQAGGIVEEVSVKTGDTVKQGDVLVRLADAGAAEAQVVMAKNAYDLLLRNAKGDQAMLWQVYLDAQKARGKVEKKWEDLNLDDIKDRIDNANNEIDDRKLELKKKQENFDKYKDLSEEDSKRKNAEDDLETAQENLNESMRKLESIERERDEVRAALDSALGVEAEAKYQYEITQNGPNADQLALAKANLDAAQDGLDGYVLTAPFDGVIADVNVTVGEQVGPETRAVSVADFRLWIVETTDLTELEVVKISEGEPVSMTVDALPDIKLDGLVSDISGSSVLQGGDVIYTVRVRVDKIDPRVRWGMTVEATFLLPKK